MRLALLLLTSLFLMDLSAQLKDPAFSISVEPTLGNRIMNFKSRTSKAFKDSINKADKWRDAVGGAVTFSYSSSKYSRVYVGLQFLNFGFTRERNSLKFLDTIHPDIGIVNDLSQSGSNDVEFNYRYQYLAIPFLISSRLQIKRLKKSQLHFMIGGSLAGLINHDIRTRLIGFSTREGKVFNLNGDEDEPTRINANLQIGLRFENLLYNDDSYVFVQPNIYLPVFRANRSDMKAQLYAFGLQVGVMVKLKKDKAK